MGAGRVNAQAPARVVAAHSARRIRRLPKRNATERETAAADGFAGRVPHICLKRAVGHGSRKATARGFEPLRAEHNGFLVHHLNHSVTLSARCFECKWLIFAHEGLAIA